MRIEQHERKVTHERSAEKFLIIKLRQLILPTVFENNENTLFSVVFNQKLNRLT